MIKSQNMRLRWGFTIVVFLAGVVLVTVSVTSAKAPRSAVAQANCSDVLASQRDNFTNAQVSAGRDRHPGSDT